MKDINARKLTIGTALRDCFYIVPDYQREYVWTDKQVNQLLEDIDEQMTASSSKYFIGTVLVAPTTDTDYTNDQNYFDVIDGQQRLTTIFLILCTLRILFLNKEMKPQVEAIKRLTKDSYTNSKGEEQTSLKLDPRYENASEIIQIIVDTDEPPEVVRENIKRESIPIYGSVEKILDAYDEIYKFLTKKYNDNNKLKKYWGHLTNNVVFIQISTEDIGSALKIFETINERGIGLNPMDLLKNLLFAQVPPNEFSRLKDKWKEISGPLEKNKEKPLRFLRYFLITNYKINTKDALIREEEIYTWFSKPENATLTEYQSKPFEFVKKIKKNVDYYIDFSKGLGNDGEPSLAMQSLKQLVGPHYRLHFILLLATVNLPKSIFDQFVYQIESFLFYHILTKGTANELEPSFSMWASEVRKIAHMRNRGKQRDALNQFVAKRFFKENMHNKRQALEDALKRLTLGTMQKYRTRYLLERLTQHVEMEFKGQKTRDSLKIYSRLEIEHILPNTPSDALLTSWKKARPEDEDPEQSYNEYKNLLGNLTLFEKPLNRSAGNDFFSKKKSKYADSGNYLTRSLARLSKSTRSPSITRINEYLCAPDEWDAEAIDDRQEKLTKLAFDAWKITEIK